MIVRKQALLADVAAPARSGVGLRLPHLSEVVATRPAVPWFEVHAENFVSNPYAFALLEKIREDYPISVHTIGISIGSADGLDQAHLGRLSDLVNRIEPFQVSGHLAWSTHTSSYLNDLLPLPYDSETLGIVICHVDEVQTLLRRRYLVENPSTYIGIKSTMSETAFLSELVRRSGCGILCDVSNIHVCAVNMGISPHRYVDELPSGAVAEFHIGGYEAEIDEAAGETILVDTHSTCISPESWVLYRYAVSRLGACPTLIEWDNNIPELATLMGEAERADQIIQATCMAYGDGIAR